MKQGVNVNETTCCWKKNYFNEFYCDHLYLYNIFNDECLFDECYIYIMNVSDSISVYMLF